MRKQKIDHDAIHTLQDLWVAGQRRQSVHIPGERGLGGPKPAAFVMNLTGQVIMRMIERGLRVYRPGISPYEKATGKPWPWNKRNAAKVIADRAMANVAKKCGARDLKDLSW
jgi:hypothetical protein